MEKMLLLWGGRKRLEKPFAEIGMCFFFEASKIEDVVTKKGGK